MPPLVFSPQDASTLYLGMQFVLKTVDGGKSWQVISPDLTGYGEQEEPEKPDPDKTASAGHHRPLTVNRAIWLNLGWHEQPAGSTYPGRWEELAKRLSARIDRAHRDPLRRCLASRPRHSLPDRGRDAESPLLLMSLAPMTTARPGRRSSTDFRNTKWSAWCAKILGARVYSMPVPIQACMSRGTEGDHWQPLSLNLPATPITDLQAHDNDLVISTFGRGLWVLDDIAPLREINPQIITADAHLFVPATAMRVRWDNYQDTPYPIETPAGQNPPDGAILDYYLKTPPAGDMTLTIYDEQGDEVTRFSTEAKPAAEYLPANAPSYWFAPEFTLPKAAGVNRFVWNLRYPSPPSLPYGYYGKLLEYTEYTLADHAIPGLTPRLQPRGPLVLPGTYTTELRVGGQTLRQSLTLELDPRVHASRADLLDQLDLAKRISRGMKASSDAFTRSQGCVKL